MRGALLLRTILLAVTASGAAFANAAPPVADARIEVFKAARELRVYSGDVLRRTYRIGLGGNPVAPKRRQGDLATPEGRYVVSHKNPHSRFYRSLGISYPNAADAGRGLRDGLITQAQHERIVAAIRARQPPPADTALGGDIFVHGTARPRTGFGAASRSTTPT